MSPEPDADSPESAGWYRRLFGRSLSLQISDLILAVIIPPMLAAALLLVGGLGMLLLQDVYKGAVDARLGPQTLLRFEGVEVLEGPDAVWLIVNVERWVWDRGMTASPIYSVEPAFQEVVLLRPTGDVERFHIPKPLFAVSPDVGQAFVHDDRLYVSGAFTLDKDEVSDIALFVWNGQAFERAEWPPGMADLAGQSGLRFEQAADEISRASGWNHIVDETMLPSLEEATTTTHGVRLFRRERGFKVQLVAESNEPGREWEQILVELDGRRMRRHPAAE